MSFSHIAILQYPDFKLQSETKELIMENISSLPLTMNLRVQYPFQSVLNDAGWDHQNYETSVCEIN